MDEFFTAAFADKRALAIGLSVAAVGVWYFGRFVASKGGSAGGLLGNGGATASGARSTPNRAAHAILEHRSKLTQGCLSTADLDKLQTDIATKFSPEAYALLRRLAQDWDRIVERKRSSSFDNSNPQHVWLLQRLWAAAFGSGVPFERVSNRWGELGFQGQDPATDFRGGGVFSLEQFVRFAETYRPEFREMMAFSKEALDNGEHHWFLPAVVSIQFSTQLALHQFMFFEEHLRVMCNAVDRSTSGSEAGSAAAASAASPEREMTATAANLGAGMITLTGAEAGLDTLHHELFLFFFARWKALKPGVMQYTQWVGPNVYSKFFSKEWRLGDSATKAVKPTK